MSIKILCLINSIPHCRTFFEKLSAVLEDRGVKFYFALDSHLSDVLYNNEIALTSFNSLYFSDFLKNEYNYNYGDESCEIFFPDFDRLNGFGVRNKFSQRSGINYRLVSGLLKKYYNKIFLEFKPDIVLYEMASNSFALSAYNQCVINKIPFFSISPSRISGRFEISETGGLKDSSTINKIFKNRIKYQIKDYYDNIAEDYIASIDNQIPDYMKTNGLDKIGLISKYLNLKKIKYLYKILIYSIFYRQDIRYSYQCGDPIDWSVAYFKRAIYRRFRFNYCNKLYENNVDLSNDGDKFFLYPLHFHPEASTSVCAPDYVDEFSVIKSIAFRLPGNCTLYVKEHPSAVALQSINFYRNIKMLPNVKLISPNYNTKDLIRKSVGVITITSTVGFEAAVLNKPVITIGNVFYNYFPNVRNIDGYLGLEDAINWAIKYKKISNHLLIKAVSSYVQYGSKGYFDFDNSANKVDFPLIADNIIEKYNNIVCTT